MKKFLNVQHLFNPFPKGILKLPGVSPRLQEVLQLPTGSEGAVRGSNCQLLDCPSGMSLPGWDREPGLRQHVTLNHNKKLQKLLGLFLKQIVLNSNPALWGPAALLLPCSASSSSLSLPHTGASLFHATWSPLWAHRSFPPHPGTLHPKTSPSPSRHSSQEHRCPEEPCFVYLCARAFCGDNEQ